MMNHEDLRIGLYSRYFAEMRSELDSYIKDAYPMMLRKDVIDGTITLKIDLSFVKKMCAGSDDPADVREAVMPEIGYRIALEMKSKIERKGNCVGFGNEVIQGKHGYYIVPEEEAAGQMSMFNAFDEIEDGVDE